MSAITITRTFALLPERSPLQSYKEITNLFVKLRALKNEYVSLMVADIRENAYFSYSSTSIGKFRQAVYDRLDFSHVLSPQFQAITLKERAKQCAFYDAYLVVREWVKRIETLKAIIDLLIDKFTKDTSFTFSFLKGERFHSKSLKEIRNALKYDCFGKRQYLSNYFLNNHLLQVRNLFLSCNDFQGTSLFSELTNNNSLQILVKKTFSSLYLNDGFIEKIATGFYRTKKKKLVSVPPMEVIEYLFGCYLRNIQWKTTKQAHQLLNLRKKLTGENSKQNPKQKAYSKTLRKIMSSLSQLLGDVEFSSQEEFTKKRKRILAPFKQAFLERIGSLDLEQFISESYHNEILDFKQNPNQYALKRILKPTFLRIRIKELSYDSLLHYIRLKLQYKIREIIKQQFISEQFTKLMIIRFQVLKEESYKRVAIPTHKALSISIMNRDVYKEDFTTKDCPKIALGFVARQFKAFKVRDEKKRMQTLKDRDFTPALPTITLKNRKLLLNLPFKKKIKDCSKPSSVGTNPALEMGIDLGLKHFAVLSIWNKEQNKELARYFLSPKQLLDMTFSHKDGPLYSPERSSIKKNPSNIKWKLIKLRKQITLLQKKKNNYEQRLLFQHITRYRTKLKWNKTRRTLSLCWNRLHRINQQIVNHLNSRVISIAKFWNISTIKVENLKWVTHTNKKEGGTFLSFWQTHWFYSQVQTAIELQCRLHSILFQKVPAYKTSQRCSSCGKLGLRKGRIFACRHCGLKLDADLNASRNIVQYKKEKPKPNNYIDTPYMGDQDSQLRVNKEDVQRCPDF